MLAFPFRGLNTSGLLLAIARALVVQMFESCFWTRNNIRVKKVIVKIHGLYKEKLALSKSICF
jgi:hypothetical protein